MRGIPDAVAIVLDVRYWRDPEPDQLSLRDSLRERAWVVRKERSMRRLILCALMVVLAAARPSYAQDARAGQPQPLALDTGVPKVGAVQRPPSVPELVVVGHGRGDKPDDFRFRLGESLSIKATGAMAAVIRTEFAKTEVVRSIILYFDGVAMTSFKPVALDLPDRTGLLLTFLLAREANDDANRNAWDALLRKQRAYTMTLPVSLAIGTALPVGVGPPGNVEFEIASPLLIQAVLWLGLAAFVVIFGVLVRWPRINSILRDGLTGQYSLGRAQMVFWGLLVFLAVLAILIVAGSLERIPTQTLMLLGISGGTGLGAALISRSQQTQTSEKIKALVGEQEQLSKDQAASPNTFPTSAQDRLRSIAADLTRLQQQQTPVSKGFLADIINDGNGPSFHRVQVVIWTILLGGVFVRSVAAVMSMPEFPESLLLLMGISNGTYLGLKIPEQN
jgi:hypothetical protein